MNAIVRTAVSAALVVGLSGCVVAIGTDEMERASSDWAEIERENRRAIDSLALGMTIGEVRAEMPHPADFTEAFVERGTEYRVLFYRTQRVDGDGATTRDETTPLVFADGELVGWGMSAWRDATGSAQAYD